MFNLQIMTFVLAQSFTQFSCNIVLIPVQHVNGITDLVKESSTKRVEIFY